jgi:hypothetical protein
MQQRKSIARRNVNNDGSIVVNATVDPACGNGLGDDHF